MSKYNSKDYISAEYCVDRIEESYIIIIDSVGNNKSVHRSKLPFHIKEGDILVNTVNGYKILDDKFKWRSKLIQNKVKGMWEE